MRTFKLSQFLLFLNWTQCVSLCTAYLSLLCQSVALVPTIKVVSPEKSSYVMDYK